MAKRASKAPKAAPKEKKAKAAPKPKGAARVVARDDNRGDDAIRENFLQHLSEWRQTDAKQKVLDKQWKDIKAALKADGHKVIQMQIAQSLSGSAKKEAKVYGEVEDRLKVARYIGHKLGAQYDLFAQPDRTPGDERWYDEGKQASMENQPKSPPHAPGTVAYTKWMEGYADHQSKIMAGFKPTEPKEPADERPRPVDTGEPTRAAGGWGPSSGDPGRPLDAA